jgi:hypothetical protein
MSSNSSGLSEVVKRLYELRCCARCVLRYVGVQDGAVNFAKPYQVCLLFSVLDHRIIKIFIIA